MPTRMSPTAPNRPADVIASAAAAGLDVLALTDHDYTAGWAEAAGRPRGHGVGLVPGIEISCRTDEGISVHLLSYLHDPAHPGCWRRSTRPRTRASPGPHGHPARRGLPGGLGRVIRHAVPGATIGRPHIADALVTAGVVSTRSEAFARC